MSVLSQPHFHDEDAAYEFVEARVWPDGPVCPRCEQSDRIGELKGNSTRKGVRKCYRCRKPFTVKINTIFESSHVPLHKWLQAMFFRCSSTEGISSHQLARTLRVQVRTAWFMSHRIREAMRSGGLARTMGSGGGAVEMDETFIGRKTGKPKGKGGEHKIAVISLVDRTSGEARSFKVDKVNARQTSLLAIRNVSREARIYTDEAAYYNDLHNIYGFDHDTVNHTRLEWRRGDVSTNTIEGFFSIFKRGMKGIYQHCSEKHLHRYLAEFDFRYNNRIKFGVDDETRTEKVLRGVKGKRLYYRQPV